MREFVHRHAAVISASAGIAWLLSGCGAGLAGIVAALGGGGGGGGGDGGTSNAPPSIVFIAPAIPAEGYHSGDVAIEFNLSDAEGDAATVDAYFFFNDGNLEERAAKAQFFALDGGNWVPVVSPLSASAAGTRYGVVWDSSSDVNLGGPGDGILPAVKWGLSLHVDEAGIARSYAFRAPLDNVPPPQVEVLAVRTENTDTSRWVEGGPYFGTVVVGYRCRTEAAATLDARLFVRIGASEPIQAAAGAVSGTSAFQNFDLRWNTLGAPAPIAGLEENVQPEVRVARLVGGAPTKAAIAGLDSIVVDNEQIAVDIKAPRVNDRIAGDVSLDLVLSHSIERVVELDVCYTDDLSEDEIDAGGAWLAQAAPATAVAAEGDGAAVPNAEPGGSPHKFIWNSYLDTQAAMPHGQPFSSPLVMLHVRARNAESGLVNERWQHAGPFSVNQGWIATAAGRKFTGDLGPATEAQLVQPWSVALGPDGSIYIADTAGRRVRRVSPEGIITTVAGNGAAGDSGDGGPAVQAQMRSPRGVAVGADGTIYIADTDNHRVRRVSPQGIIATVAGNGIPGYLGDGGPAAQAQLNYPDGIALGPEGSIYIADTENQRIRFVSPQGVIATVAGTGAEGYNGDDIPALEAQLHHPGAVAVDSDGSMYIADTENQRIRFVSPQGAITTVAGIGAEGYNGDDVPAAEAQLHHPRAVVIGPEGSVYIADTGNHRVRRVSPGGIITTVAGTGTGSYGGDGGPAVQAGLNYPRGVAVRADGSVYVADTNNVRVRRVSPEGSIATVAGSGIAGYSGDAGPATLAQLDNPCGLAVGAGGSLYIADTDSNRIRRVSPEGIITTVAGNGTPGYSGNGGPAVQAQLNHPRGVALGADGAIYIADTGNNRIRRVSPDGVITLAYGNGTLAQLAGPGGVATSSDGSVYIADTGNHRIRRLLSGSLILTVAGIGIEGYSGDGGPAAEARLANPCGVAVGPDGSFLIADTGNHCIRRVSPEGIITTVAGTGTEGYSGDGGPATEAELNDPRGVAIGAEGSIAIADTGNHRLRRVLPEGAIATMAGTGAEGYSGDDGPALEAQLNDPCGVAAGPDGSFYAADTANHRVRRLFAAP